MKPHSQYKSRQLLVAMLGACVTLAHAMPGIGSPPRPIAPMAEPMACVVLDAGTADRLKLSADQLAEWQRLRQEHEQLFDGHCQPTAAATEMSAKPEPAPGHRARAMSVYRTDFLEFLGGLSTEQCALLVDAASLREEGNHSRNGRNRLEEKLIRHRLML